MAMRVLVRQVRNVCRVAEVGEEGTERGLTKFERELTPLQSGKLIFVLFYICVFLANFTPLRSKLIANILGLDRVTD